MEVELTRTAPRAQAIHSSGGSPRAAMRPPSLKRLTYAHRRMSCRNDGERDENQRPELIASRSSMVRIGSSMVCLLGDWKQLHCRVRDQAIRSVLSPVCLCLGRLACDVQTKKMPWAERAQGTGLHQPWQAGEGVHS